MKDSSVAFERTVKSYLRRLLSRFCLVTYQKQPKKTAQRGCNATGASGQVYFHGTIWVSSAQAL